jgi:hypothetical protein
VRGRPKRNPGRRAEPGVRKIKRQAELSFRKDADLSRILVGNTVWRIKRRSVWNTMATESAAYVCRRRQRLGAEALA